MKAPPWSYSSLTNFETCPRRYYLTRVSKEVVEKQTEAAVWGDRVHKALEARIRDGVPLSESFAAYEQVVQVFLEKADDWWCERQYALTEDFKPCAWDSPDAWVRGIVDIGRIKGYVGRAYDWKTGKIKPDIDQLQLFAAMMMYTHEVGVVHTGYVWLQFGETTPKKYSLKDLAAIWQNFLPRVERFERAFAKDKWIPKPSGLCKGWCPCTGCEFNERKRR